MEDPLTEASEAIIPKGVIDAKQKRDVMVLDIPNAFVQIEIALDGYKVIMKIIDQLVNIIIEIFPGVYHKYFWYKVDQKILYIRKLKSLYRILVSLILYYKKSRKYIETIVFEVDTYNICVTNQIKSGKKQTVTWHVNDLKSSHIDTKVNEKFD